MGIITGPKMTWAQAARGSSPPVDTNSSAQSQSLEHALAPRAVICSCGARSSEPSGSLKIDPQAGSIRHLGDVPTSKESVAAQQTVVLNPGAGNHPCAVILISACGHLAFCSPITSFAGAGIEAKYVHCRNDRKRQDHYDEYIPFEEHGTKQVNAKGMLQYTGGRMKCQSWAHLDFGYWIELRHLRSWGGRALTSPALAHLKAQYAAAEIYRQVHGRAGERRIAKSKSPPASRKRSHTGSSGGSSPRRSPSPKRQQRWALPTPSPSPPPFDRRSPSPEKAKAMKGDWRQ